ncbi:hypothetical protein ACFQY0_00020 [Haloferula chungangensis]|uniref:SLA1 homology domain-containing protein n=1 Tax=Haloferula chungangensis TaxID=1048331 RepID=A0ABW2L1J7_9BACT
MNIYIRSGVAALALAMVAQAAETRTWTSRKGSNVDAQLLKVEGSEVILLTPESREIKLKVEDLSLADRQYLIEYGGAAPEVVASGELGEPENEVKIDTGTFKKLEKPLLLGGSTELSFELLESEHFLIATTGLRPQAMAETAERMWHGMSFEHMNFRKDWGDKKTLIFVVDDEEIYKSLGDWYGRHLESEKAEQDTLNRVAATWNEVSSTTMNLPDDLVSERNLEKRAIVFNARDDRKFKKEMSPFPVHVVAGYLLGKQMGGVSNFGADGYFAISTGFAYFKEIHLTGKTETNLIDVQGSQFDDITTKSGFDDGKSWAKTLRTLVKREKVKPDIEQMLSWKSTDLDPEKLVLIYSFGYYCNSTPKRLSGFANLVRRVETSNQIPEPIELAKIMGFDSVEALQEDWIEFVVSSSFK